jgi:hypothetical protein
VPSDNPRAGGEKSPSQQDYLAAELGHSIDYWGEPSGLEGTLTGMDTDFRDFTVALWKQIQSTRSIGTQLREMEREGLTPTDLWAPGTTELMPTASTSDDMRRYKQKLLFRANILEAMLMETVQELKRLDRMQPIDAADPGANTGASNGASNGASTGTSTGASPGTRSGA